VTLFVREAGVEDEEPPQKRAELAKKRATPRRAVLLARKTARPSLMD